MSISSRMKGFFLGMSVMVSSAAAVLIPHPDDFPTELDPTLLGPGGRRGKGHPHTDSGGQRAHRKWKKHRASGQHARSMRSPKRGRGWGSVTAR